MHVVQGLTELIVGAGAPAGVSGVGGAPPPMGQPLVQQLLGPLLADVEGLLPLATRCGKCVGGFECCVGGFECCFTV